MAFTTEFVMGAGGSVEMFEPTFTPWTQNSRGTLATQAVGVGQWLVAVHINRYMFNAPSLWINNVQTLGASAQDSPASTTSVVAGPGTITIDGNSISSGHVYIVRID